MLSVIRAAETDIEASAAGIFHLQLSAAERGAAVGSIPIKNNKATNDEWEFAVSTPKTPGFCQSFQD